jgi:multidrug efflux system membrane fusion protein
MKIPAVLVACAVLLLPACKKPAPAFVRPPKPVIAATAEARDVPLYIDVIGRCAAFQVVMIRPQVSGPVVAIHFTDGADVKKGDPLFTIDPRPFQAAYDTALAKFTQEQAKAQFDLAQFERNKKLSARNVVSPQDLDSARATDLASQAALVASKAQVESAKISLDYCTIVSPVEGRTGKHLVDIGTIVEANNTDLMEIQRQIPLYVEFVIPENELPRVRSYIAKGTLSLQAALPEDPSTARPGKLDFLDNGVKITSGTVLMRGLFPNEDRFFWPGQFVQVRILLDTLPQAILIPAEAVQTGADNLFVFVVGEDSRVQVRSVKAGQLQNRQIVITEGLAAGEKVVVTGQLGLSNGAVVAEQPATKP